MSTNLALPLSRSVLTTTQPPSIRTRPWIEAYPATPARPLLDVSQGIPGNPPPDVLLRALANTSSSPQSAGYGPFLGEPTLRAAFAKEMKTVYGKNADITANDVGITAGCTMSYIAAVMCLAEVGDEVILPVPWYFNHSMALNLLGIKSIPLYTRSDQGFLPSTDECKKLITSKTKAITFVTPNNPTGVIYSPTLIAQFAELARENNIALIIDETYRDFVEYFPPHHLFSPTDSEILSPSWSWRSNFIHLFSFSKSYAIPGHRLGAIVAAPELLKYITITLDCTQVCASRPAQLAFTDETLLSELRIFIRSNATLLKTRHDLLRKSLPSGWTVAIGSLPVGGYFAFVKHPFHNISSITFCERLAKELGVVVLPAQIFYSEDQTQMQALGLAEEGWDRWLRFSVSNVDDKQILDLCERLKECAAHFE